MRTYEYDGNEVAFEIGEYANGGLAVMMLRKEDMMWEPMWEQYADLTVWLFDTGDTMAFVDENNLPGIGKWLEENGLARHTGIMAPSGYCLYPLYEFTDRFFDGIA